MAAAELQPFRDSTVKKEGKWNEKTEERKDNKKGNSCKLKNIYITITILFLFLFLVVSAQSHREMVRRRRRQRSDTALAPVQTSARGWDWHRDSSRRWWDNQT